MYIYFIFAIFNCALYLIINFYYINISIDEKKILFEIAILLKIFSHIVFWNMMCFFFLFLILHLDKRKKN